MQGVTTAIVLFVFACVLFPRLIANRAQFHAGFALTLAAILLDGLAHIVHVATFDAFAYLFTAILQVGAIVLLYLAAGGLTARGLSREMLGAFEVIRRGEEEREVIIPRRNDE